MQTRRIQRALVIILGGLVASVLAFPLSAGAFTFDIRQRADGNTYLEVARELESGAATITVQESNTTVVPTNNSSAWDDDANWNGIGSKTILMDSLSDGFQYPLYVATTKSVRVRSDDASGTTRRVVLTTSPVNLVRFAETPTVNIGTQPAVSLSSSVSVAGTMPVDIQTVPEWFEGLAGLAAAVMGFAVVSFVWGWRTR